MHGALDQARRVHEVIARRNFWNDAAVFFVLRDLRSHFTREQLRAELAAVVAQNGDGRFVAGCFEREDGHAIL